MVVVETAAATDIKCPFEYLLAQYGKHHFAPFVKALSPSLKTEDPATYRLVLDIMDAVHFCSILVDDIADNSQQRKNKPTAHMLFGGPETANRAYLVLTRVINRTVRQKPQLAAEIMKALENILEGQDLSLVWRRDGLEDSFPSDDIGRRTEYKRMAQLKTGTLFVLLGRLLNNGEDDLDDKMTRFGGVVAEDLRNGELSYPIVEALILDKEGGVVAKALHSRSPEDIEAALEVLESQPVKAACLKAMQDACVGVELLEAVWGRRESMEPPGLESGPYVLPQSQLYLTEVGQTSRGIEFQYYIYVASGV
ncbi:histone deacetylase [Apiospora arundinis]